MFERPSHLYPVAAKRHGWAGDCWKVRTHISLTRRRTWKHLFTSHWLHIEGTHFKKFNKFLQQFWIQGPCLLKSTTTYYIRHGEITCRKKLMYTACRNNSYDCQSRSMFATILWAYETLVTISITTINPNELISYRWLYRLSINHCDRCNIIGKQSMELIIQ